MKILILILFTAVAASAQLISNAPPRKAIAVTPPTEVLQLVHSKIENGELILTIRSISVSTNYIYHEVYNYSEKEGIVLDRVEVARKVPAKVQIIEPEKTEWVLRSADAVAVDISPKLSPPIKVSP